MTKQTVGFNSTDEKASYVQSMFARIAGRYDLMNRLMSLGRDQSWRRRAVELAAVPPGGRMLDVAVGTGDLALTALTDDRSVRVAGVDFTVEMMRLGQRKEEQFRARSKQAQQGRQTGVRAIEWVAGDALRLPFPDGVFDAAVSGFMMRNVTDVATAFSEQRRVVRPGGRVVCLEITHPRLPVWRDIYRWIFGSAMPKVTGLLSGQPDAYRYLPTSLRGFVGADELKAIMERVGLRGVGYQTMMLGTVAIHVGIS
jgi:demethylmenaquinone methyltransferase/2-methoxy-6-polyprenyl-1,4-benzoquinol methylase